MEGVPVEIEAVSGEFTDAMLSQIRPVEVPISMVDTPQFPQET